MNKLISIFFIFICTIYLNGANEIVDNTTQIVQQNVSKKLKEQTKQQIIEAKKIIQEQERLKKEQEKKLEDEKKLAKLDLELKDIEQKLKNNILLKRYSNYRTYRDIEAELNQIKSKLKKLSKSNIKKVKELVYQLNNKIKIKENELQLISEYKDSPIGNLIKPPEITVSSKINNPWEMVEAFSNIKILNSYKINYSRIKNELETLQPLLTKQISIIKQILQLKPDKKLEKKLNYLQREQKDFFLVHDIVSTTNDVYSRRIEQIVLEMQNNIKKQAKEILYLVLILLSLFIVATLVKMVVKKYIKDDDRHYSTHRLINFVFVFIVIVVLLFTYIDNASNLVTFLGFASAGIAIALKDWFMSMFGWIVIMTSGSIKVGDRIKVTKDGTEAVGDVLDISLFKISIREDITLTSYMKNRRTGRVFFIPNNYVFTDLIANYTYDSLRTVWDGIDINITFDSNHKKAAHLAKEIAKQYSKGYADITRKSLGKMRTKYVLRSTGVDPRVFTFAESYGIVVSTWYFTNSHATLALRSTISMEILDAFKAADDITIAYPTQTLRVNAHASSNPDNLLPGTSQTGLFDGEDLG
jgi:small-conductance mechanosensitive channel